MLHLFLPFIGSGQVSPLGHPNPAPTPSLLRWILADIDHFIKLDPFSFEVVIYIVGFSEEKVLKLVVGVVLAIERISKVNIFPKKNMDKIMKKFE